MSGVNIFDIASHLKELFQQCVSDDSQLRAAESVSDRETVMVHRVIPPCAAHIQSRGPDRIPKRPQRFRVITLPLQRSIKNMQLHAALYSPALACFFSQLQAETGGNGVSRRYMHMTPRLRCSFKLAFGGPVRLTIGATHRRGGRHGLRTYKRG